MSGMVKAEESEFMDALLAGLDESFFITPTSTPHASPHRSQPPPRSAKHARVHSVGSSPLKKKPNTSTSGDGSIVTENWTASSSHGDSFFSSYEPTPKAKGKQRATPLTETQAKAATAAAYSPGFVAAAELCLQADDAWMLSAEFEPLLPSPKKSRARHTPDCSPSKAKRNRLNLGTLSSASQHPASLGYVRCRVDDVQISQYTPPLPANHTTKGVQPETLAKLSRRTQIVLSLTQLGRKGDASQSEEEMPTKRMAYLRDDWQHTRVRRGDYVHLIGVWESVRHVDVSIADDDVAAPSAAIPTMTLANSGANGEAENLLVLHPDLLLSATAISSVVTCTRKPFLQAKVKPSGPGADDKQSEALVMGRMLHEVLQSCLTGVAKQQPDSQSDEKPPMDCFEEPPSSFPTEWHGPADTNFADDFVKRCIVAQVGNSLDDLILVDLDTRSACKKLWEATLPFGPFASTYLSNDSSGEALDGRSAVPPMVRVVQIHDVEEDIWSPMYGLKGYVDVSVEIELTERTVTDAMAARHGHNAAPCTHITRSMMPLELKTGRTVNLIEHRAQTMLYSLMMSDRYRQKIDCGLLYYSRTADLHLVRTARNEVRGLIVARNELVSYLSKRNSREEKDMGLMGIAVEQSDVLPPSIDDQRTCSRCYIANTCMLYRKAVEVRTEDDEDEVDMSAVGPLYSAHTTHLSAEHVAFFRHWDRLLTYEETDSVNHRREMWTMTAAARERTGRCYSNMVMTVCPTHVRAKHAVADRNTLHYRVYRFKRAKGESGAEALLLGGHFSVGDKVCVSIEPSLLAIGQGFLLELTPMYMVLGLDRRLEPIARRAGERTPVFRIDRDEQVSSMVRIRYNLAKLFFQAPAGDARRCRLIVDLEAPRFREYEGKYDFDANEGLNVDQRAALNKVLCADDYALLVGMPGTGKTTTIASLVTLLARQGKSVLLASYTHSAVDTICRKLVDVKEVRLLRLGSADRVHDDVRGHTLAASNDVETLKERLLLPNVVATTCLSVGHALFALRPAFDYCIIDEASQITIPTCIGPLRYAEKFVLVGDPQQLPPLVRDPRAREGGLDVSLFERLQLAHPEAVVHLCHQYRMNEDIMTLSNTLVYGGRLRCGTEGIGAAELAVPQSDAALRSMHDGGEGGCMTPCWLATALEPATRALFVNTDAVPALRETRTGDLVENGGEAHLASQLCTALVRAGVAQDEIAVLTPYRQQIKRIAHLLQSAADTSAIEVLTADKAQGRDKDVVIVSFVRSQEETDDRGVGILLNDIRRINVALTRARKKLVLLGSRRTLSNSALLARLWSLMDERGWTHNLTDGLDVHYLPTATPISDDLPSSVLATHVF